MLRVLRLGWGHAVYIGGMLCVPRVVTYRGDFMGESNSSVCSAGMNGGGWSTWVNGLIIALPTLFSAECTDRLMLDTGISVQRPARKINTSDANFSISHTHPESCSMLKERTTVVDTVLLSATGIVEHRCIRLCSAPLTSLQLVVLEACCASTPSMLSWPISPKTTR